MTQAEEWDGNPQGDLGQLMYKLPYKLRELLREQKVVQLVLKFGATQEIKDSTEIIPQLDHLELVHASKGKTLILYDSILFINTVPRSRYEHHDS